MTKGNFIEYVISDISNKYPNNGEQDGYYYKRVITETEEKTVTAGTSPIEVIPSEGKSISKVTVNHTPTEEKTVTPTTENLIVAPVEGKQLSQVTVQGDANFIEENIAEGITMWGKTGTHQGGGSGQYVWSKHESETGPFIEYVTGEAKADYPDGGWQDGAWYTLKLVPVPPAYLSFLGNEDFTLKTNNTTKNWDGTLEYSTDKSTWNTWDGTEISSAGSKLYLRGTGNTKIAGAPSTDYKFVFTGTNTLKIACEGNIENLLDYETVSAGEHPTMYNYYCYSNMFQDCTSLISAPELPATTLANGCYYNMFSGCTSLITAPALPATTLADYCYSNMFQDCTSLTTVPALPATTLVTQCYNNMFWGCTSLTTIPELSATTLAQSCYENMFFECTSIKLSTTKTGEYQTVYRIPKSGTGTTATNALQNMFYGTGGTFTGTPSINTTYYTSNTVV